MAVVERKPAVLLLKDGTVFHGKSAGKIGTTTGEVCFNTGMTGYQEIFTDPSYYGQLMVMTNAHIGNYGILEEEAESKDVKIEGLICKNFTNEFSRLRSNISIQEYLLEQELVGISDIDTRALVRHIRDKGAMNAIISSENLDLDSLKKQLEEVPSMAGLELASVVSTKEAYTLGNEESHHRIAVMDYGVKQNILRSFVARGCYLKVFPAKTPLEEVAAWQPDGYFLSNGPGDPSPMTYATDFIQGVMEKGAPIFGICLGQQLLAQAVGMETYKMHHGHRGINHPVKNIKTGRCEITSQNHGFGVSKESIEAQTEKVEITHINLNDDTIEGFRLRNYPAFTVQYHPEAAPGPHDSHYLFDDFIKLMDRSN